jgi:hypothetical protein
MRAAEWAAWTRTLPWRVAASLGIGVGGGVLGSLLAPRPGVAVGALVAMAAGWGCGSGPARTPLPGGGGRSGSGALPGSLASWSGTSGPSCRTWPSPAARPILIIWPSAPGGVRDRLQAVELLGRIVGSERVAAEPESAAEIVGFCGRLPLAIRVAGARLAARPGWPLAQLAGLLADARRRLDQLAAGDLEVRASLELSGAQRRAAAGVAAAGPVAQAALDADLVVSTGKGHSRLLLPRPAAVGRSDALAPPCWPVDHGPGALTGPHLMEVGWPKGETPWEGIGCMRRVWRPPSAAQLPSRSGSCLPWHPICVGCAFIIRLIIQTIGLESSSSTPSIRLVIGRSSPGPTSASRNGSHVRHHLTGLLLVRSWAHDSGDRVGRSLLSQPERCLGRLHALVDRG